MIDLDDILSTTEAAEAAGKSAEAVCKALQRGSLRGKNLGRQWVTTRDELALWLAWTPVQRRHNGTGRFLPKR